MHIYRICISLPGGRRQCHTGLFADGFEAVLQSLADWPEARAVSATCVRRAAA